MYKNGETRFPDQPNQEINLGLHVHGENVVPYHEMVRRREQSEARDAANRAIDIANPVTDMDTVIIVSGQVHNNRTWEVAHAA